MPGSVSHSYGAACLPVGVWGAARSAKAYVQRTGPESLRDAQTPAGPCATRKPRAYVQRTGPESLRDAQTPEGPCATRKPKAHVQQGSRECLRDAQALAAPDCVRRLGRHWHQRAQNCILELSAGLFRKLRWLFRLGAVCASGAPVLHSGAVCEPVSRIALVFPTWAVICTSAPRITFWSRLRAVLQIALDFAV